MSSRWLRRAVLLLALGALVAGGTLAQSSLASQPHVLRVGTWNGIPGQFKTIQAAALAAKPGDWILVAPGDYRETGYQGAPEPAGVLITTPNLHLRGMDRNTTIVDGTKSGPACSSNPLDQGPLARNGVVVLKADNTWVENLTVCNFLTGPTGGEGNQIWWNGGDGGGSINLHGFWGNYLTASSTYSSSVAGALGPCCGVNYPAGDYGIFSSDSSNGWFKYSYASNMADSSYYIGACQQQCDQLMDHDISEGSALCLSSTNAGGWLLIEHTLCRNNKTGLVSNSQNNDDQPSPQNGLCPPGVTGPLGTQSCTVWYQNTIVDNNNPNVPGNGTGLSGQGPVGTGMILAGSRYVTLAGNDVENNGAWGELVADLPDQEAAPAPYQQCRGGTIYESNSQICYYQAYGNVSENNRFSGNGGFGNPSNGDVALATVPNNPGNCFTGDSDPAGLTTDPPGIESNPLYAPANGICSSPNGGDDPVLLAGALCATQLLGPPCPAFPVLTNYPRPAARFNLLPIPAEPSMADPCAGVPSNPWCP